MSKDAVINQEAVETVKDIIKDVETAMLSTISEGGINSRPMQTQDIEFDGDLWFLTKKDTEQIQGNPGESERERRLCRQVVCVHSRHRGNRG